MRMLKTTSVLAALGLALAAAPAVAQTAPPAGQKPAAPAEPQKPAPAQPAPQAKPPVPFPEGAKIAYIDYNFVAATSDEGKAATAKIQALQKKKTDELAEKQKALQAQQTKLQQGVSVMNEQARGQLERDIERMQRELQFAQQDAQDEVNELTQQLQNEFGQKVGPIVEALANERGLHMIFSAQQGGIAWAHPGLDLSDEVVTRLNAAKPAAPKK